MQDLLIDVSPLSYFESLVRDDKSFMLLEAAISIAQDACPALDIQQVLGDVDALQRKLERRVAADAPALQRLRALNQFFFGELRFASNVNDHFDPGNAFVHHVLHLRRGAPLTLSLLWMELARALDLKVCVVGGFLGYFMLRVTLPQGEVVIDPASSGKSLSKEELVEKLCLGSEGHASEDDIKTLLGMYLRPVPPRELLGSLLRTLRDIHLNHQKLELLLTVHNRLIVLYPQAWSEYRDRANTIVALRGCVNSAIRDMETYLAHSAGAADQDEVERKLRNLKRSVAGCGGETLP